jgi:hypothetical protein
VVTSLTRSPSKRERESHIPYLSNCNNQSSKDNSEATLAEFDLRSLEQDLGNSLNTLDDQKKYSTEDEDDFFPRNLMYDPDRVLDGMLVLKCLFCEHYKTPIQNDMRIHLRYTHQMELLNDLPLSGKGFNMEYRAAYAIDIMKQIVPREYYDHRTARFTPEVENNVLDFFSYKYFME